jgi:hypothetical protein
MWTEQSGNLRVAKKNTSNRGPPCHGALTESPQKKETETVCGAGSCQPDSPVTSPKRQKQPRTGFHNSLQAVMISERAGSPRQDDDRPFFFSFSSASFCPLSCPVRQPLLSRASLLRNTLDGRAKCGIFSGLITPDTKLPG